MGCLLNIPFNSDAASTKDVSSKAETSAAATKQPQQQQPRASSYGVDQDSTLTIGDTIEQHLQTNRIGNKTCLTFFCQERTLLFFLLILNFPTFSQCA